MALIKIDILNHADYGGEFKEYENAPGLAKFYSAIESVRSKNRDNTLLLDAGDNINRILWHGKEVFEGLDLIKTDCMVLGNHEFDRGLKQLEENIDYIKDKFPILCANILVKETNDFIKGVKPYVVLEKNGIKYGIIGVTTEYTQYMVDSNYFASFKVSSQVEALRKYITEARDDGAEVIICLTHFPFYFTEDSESGELIEVLKQISDLKPDVMIGGHIPGDYARVVMDCAVTKGGFGGKSLPHITLTFDTETRKVVDKKCTVIDVLNGNFEADKNIQKFVDRVTAPYEYYFSEVLAIATEDIPMRLSVESPMANLITDAVREYTKTDIVYFNCTSCGRKISKGDITRFTISKAMGFNDPLHQGFMTGKQIWNLFELVLDPKRFGNNANIMFSGMKVKIDNTKPAFSKVVSITLEDGSSIDLEKKYTVTTSAYMASGGNETGKITNQIDWKNTNVPIYDTLFEYVKKHKEIKRPELGRYPMIGHPENDNSPW
ncbi:MAG TPA: 5'-nucleotidase C-terminal domain-containing protein [Erysipelotrichaceae bacterium]|nr:5'-nucleotidase C-terminal domain-containing protein [Erysipelotrichaceae bacterium]HQA85039.1 5'-nucleotidase C-terminal domain-containing protein [Erysipelotrichaceae bacterium]